MECDSAQLAERAAQGDATAIETLLARHLPGLRAFIRLRTGPLLRARESSSDLAQSVCREVLQHISRFRYPSESAFKHWLYATALRRIQNRRSYWLAQKRDAGRDVVLPAAKDDSQELVEPYAALSTPSQHLMAKERLAQVESAFDQLSDDEREVVTLSRIVGLPHREIATQMGRTEQATRALLYRAMTRLAHLLDDDSDV
ncbi:MAG: sigma-70 family RNA polymerase sigma factor [Planctomycetota bacterium]